tara:strand:+ start:873 stop:1178 length:306 start_codon:yes stop_codon:yes gene_type:complete
MKITDVGAALDPQFELAEAQEEIVRLKGEAESWEKVFDRTCQLLADAKTKLAEATVKESLTTQRPWVGLTGDEIWQEWSSPKDSAIDFAKAIEAKLKDKNT